MIQHDIFIIRVGFFSNESVGFSVGYGQSYWVY